MIHQIGHGTSIEGSRRVASEEELGLVHPLPYLRKLQELSQASRETVMLDESTYLAPGSYQAVAEGVGAVLSLLDALLGPQGIAVQPYSLSSNSSSSSTGPGRAWESGRQQQHEQQLRASMGFALVRPPGHHVLPTRPMGFGLVNTISIAARYAQQKHGAGRVLIFGACEPSLDGVEMVWHGHRRGVLPAVLGTCMKEVVTLLTCSSCCAAHADFDVHHGNGTMEVFYQDPSVLYISTHQVIALLCAAWPRLARARLQQDRNEDTKHDLLVCWPCNHMLTCRLACGLTLARCV